MTTLLTTARRVLTDTHTYEHARPTHGPWSHLSDAERLSSDADATDIERDHGDFEAHTALAKLVAFGDATVVKDKVGLHVAIAKHR